MSAVARPVHQQVDEDILQDPGRFSLVQSLEVDLGTARRSRRERGRSQEFNGSSAIRPTGAPKELRDL